MSDSPHGPAPDNAPQSDNVPAPAPTGVPAEIVPETPHDPAHSEEPRADSSAQPSADETEDAEAIEEPRPPDDPIAVAADRAGFKFLAIGFALFFALIAICASIVALVMKSMGI